MYQNHVYTVVINYGIFFLQMCLALRYFATGANYSVIGDTQGVTKSTVCRAVNEVADFFHANQGRFIRWPKTLQERCEISAEFKANFGGVAGVLGCVDGTHIGIIAPSEKHRGFLNRKGFHSINAMVRTKTSVWKNTLESTLTCVNIDPLVSEMA